MVRTVRSALIAAMAFGVGACAQTPSAPSAPSAPASEKPAKPGVLVHTPAPPPPEIHEDAGAPRPPVVGGYTSAGPVDEADASQKAARDFAVAEIYKKFPQRGLVESATVKLQVVAGVNYQFHIAMTGAKAYDVVVYRDLQGRMSLSKLDAVGK